MTKLLYQFGCTSISVLVKKFASDKSGLVELNDAMKTFLSLSVRAKRNTRMTIDTDCLPQDESLSDEDEYTMVDSNEEDDNGIARADRRA